MWISRKHYNFLMENAEKNIDAECEILRTKDNYTQAVARAMEEYSETLKELDRIKNNLKYYLDTNEENGVVYIPKFIVENMACDGVSNKQAINLLFHIGNNIGRIADNDEDAEVYLQAIDKAVSALSD